MIIRFARKYRSLFAGGLILAHFVVFFFAPWLHRHPDEDHATVSGEFYHSHLPPFASHETGEDEIDHAKDTTPHLLDEESLPLEVRCRLAKVNSCNFINLVKCVFHTDSTAPTFSAILDSSRVGKILFIPLTLRDPGEYYVLTAANLSPPQA